MKHSSHRSHFQTKRPSVGQQAEFTNWTRCEICIRKIITLAQISKSYGFMLKLLDYQTKIIQLFFAISWIFIKINFAARLVTQLLTWCHFLSAFVDHLIAQPSGFSYRPFVLLFNSSIAARPFQGQFQKQRVFSIRSTIAARTLCPLTLSSVPTVW